MMDIAQKQVMKADICLMVDRENETRNILNYRMKVPYEISEEMKLEKNEQIYMSYSKGEVIISRKISDKMDIENVVLTKVIARKNKESYFHYLIIPYDLMSKLNIFKDTDIVTQADVKIENNELIISKVNDKIKEGQIYISITNNTVNYKIKLQEDWCNELGLKEGEDIYISYEKGDIVIEKFKKPLFSALTPEQKTLQIKKYAQVIQDQYKEELSKAKLADLVAVYFNVSDRTVYRYIDEDVRNDLENVELIEKQKKYIRKSKIMTSYIITIPSILAFLLLQGKTKEELGIKNMVEIYDKNQKQSVFMKCESNRIVITR